MYKLGKYNCADEYKSGIINMAADVFNRYIDYICTKKIFYILVIRGVLIWFMCN